MLCDRCRRRRLCTVTRPHCRILRRRWRTVWRLSWPLSPSGRRCWPPTRAFGVRSSSCRCPSAADRGPCRSTSTLRLRRSCCCGRSSGASGAMQQVCAGAAKRATRDRGAHLNRHQGDTDARLHGPCNFFLHHSAAARSRCRRSCLLILFARWALKHCACRRVSVLSACRTMGMI